jgi:predicted O-methyltransferase YrrM
MLVDLLPNKDQFDRFHRSAAMSLPAILQLKNLLLESKPRSILEIGSGLSSLLLARYKKSFPTTEIVSFDNPGPWNNTLKEFLEADSLDTTFLRTYPVNPENKFYAISEEEIQSLNRQFDLVIVDGPWDPLARACPVSLRILKAAIGPDTSIIVDDSQRGCENNLVQHLKTFHGAWKYDEIHITDNFKGQGYRRTTFLQNIINPDGPSLIIGMTAWPRYMSRVNYVDKVLASVFERIFLSYGYLKEIVVSAETDKVSPDLWRKFLEICQKYRVSLVQNPAPAALANNLNLLIENCKSDYILFLEDDWEVQDSFDLGKSLFFLDQNKSEGFHSVRYKRSPDKSNNIVEIGDPNHFKELLPENTVNFLPYNPHIKSRELIEMLGPHVRNPASLETGGEGHTNQRGKDLAKEGKLRVAVTPFGTEFGHIGVESSMTEKWAQFNKTHPKQ